MKYPVENWLAGVCVCGLAHLHTVELQAKMSIAKNRATALGRTKERERERELRAKAALACNVKIYWG